MRPGGASGVGYWWKSRSAGLAAAWRRKSITSRRWRGAGRMIAPISRRCASPAIPPRPRETTPAGAIGRKEPGETDVNETGAALLAMMLDRIRRGARGPRRRRIGIGVLRAPAQGCGRLVRKGEGGCVSLRAPGGETDARRHFFISAKFPVFVTHPDRQGHRCAAANPNRYGSRAAGGIAILVGGDPP